MPISLSHFWIIVGVWNGPLSKAGLNNMDISPIEILMQWPMQLAQTAGNYLDVDFNTRVWTEQKAFRNTQLLRHSSPHSMSGCNPVQYMKSAYIFSTNIYIEISLFVR